MIYTIEKANLIKDQLKSFVNQPTFILVGHFGNIQFWMGEVKTAVQAIDDYYKRFKIMSGSRQTYIENHDKPIHEYCVICKGKCELSSGIPSNPKRIANSELKEVKTELLNTFYYFLIRGFNSGIIEEKAFITYCEALNIGYDKNDFSEKN